MNSEIEVGRETPYYFRDETSVTLKTGIKGEISNYHPVPRVTTINQGDTIEVAAALPNVRFLL